ncbi:hypothetical protein [Neptunomonas japonica]|uniref:Uncharacterized protein n=1 Tax=Neptunomonas japonica JAMM 1380 TaxID=1441457 RepID=A0A7R6PE38_9GAMM|nr:hypothetical protein [Neptunomonas japonica]BBB28402.1 hypothetical protein NEJAP_0445 [Neptunomonas japonica JAMM 1380]
MILNKCVMVLLLLVPCLNAFADGIKVHAFGINFLIPSEYVFNINSIDGAPHFYSDTLTKDSIYFGEVKDCDYCAKVNEDGFEKEKLGCLGNAEAFNYRRNSYFSEDLYYGYLFYNKYHYMIIPDETTDSNFWEKYIDHKSCELSSAIIGERSAAK